MTCHYWGRNLPSQWVWLSGNDFDRPGTGVEIGLIRSRLWGARVPLPRAGYTWLTTDGVRSPTGRPWSSAAPASMAATRPAADWAVRDGRPDTDPTTTAALRTRTRSGGPVNAVQSTFPRWIGPDRNSARSPSGPAGNGTVTRQSRNPGRTLARKGIPLERRIVGPKPIVAVIHSWASDHNM